jgi:rubrerythrin
MTTSKADVIQAAVQLERDGRMFYLDIAGKASDDATRQMFESLADDELDHKDWIESLEPGVDTAETANRKLYDRLRHIFADVPEARLRRLAQSDNDVKAIQAALKMEKESVDAYEQWAADCEDADVQSLCKTLAGIERFHIQVLNNTFEYFERTPDWFMREEQWNFEGA